MRPNACGSYPRATDRTAPQRPVSWPSQAAEAPGGSSLLPESQTYAGAPTPIRVSGTSRAHVTNVDRLNCSIVLVVDDYDEARGLLAEYLSTVAGFNVETANNGRQAVELARHLRPAVVNMDLAMPVLDGVEATRQIKADPQTNNIVVIALTAFRPEDYLPRRAIEAGCAEVLTKPVDVKHLERRIRHYCKLQAIPPDCSVLPESAA